MKRRELLLAGTAAAALGCAQAASSSPTRTLKVLQWLDASDRHRELSRDHAAGVQAGIVEYNRSAAGMARPLQLRQIEIAGDADLAAAVSVLRSDAQVGALLGVAGEALALRSIALVREHRLGLPIVAPWLADTRFDADEDVLALFASREVQIRHALTQLQGIGVDEIGLVFGTPSDEALLAGGVTEMAGRMGLRLRSLGALDSPRLNGELSQRTAVPAVVLFLGATLELARLAQLFAQRGLQRYLVSLADVDVATLTQLGAGRSVPLIVTQVVPNPLLSALDVVRDYRRQLKLLFDEAPTPLSLAGYLASRYFTQVLERIDGPLTRERLQQAFARRPSAELGGFDIRFAGPASRGSRFVTQTMLTADGRLLG